MLKRPANAAQHGARPLKAVSIYRTPTLTGSDGTGQAGDVVHQRPGIVHYLYDYSPDMEYLEIVSPADFKTVDMPPATDKVPPVTPWK